MVKRFHLSINLQQLFVNKDVQFIPKGYVNTHKNLTELQTAERKRYQMIRQSKAQKAEQNHMKSPWPKELDSRKNCGFIDGARRQSHAGVAGDRLQMAH